MRWVPSQARFRRRVSSKYLSLSQIHASQVAYECMTVAPLWSDLGPHLPVPFEIGRASRPGSGQKTDIATCSIMLGSVGLVAADFHEGVIGCCCRQVSMYPERKSKNERGFGQPSELQRGVGVGFRRDLNGALIVSSIVPNGTIWSYL